MLKFDSALTFLFNIWMDRFFFPLPDQPSPSSPLHPPPPPLHSLSPPRFSSLLLSISSNKPIAESLCSSTLRLTSVSELTRERNRERGRDRDSGREASREKGRERGFSWAFFRGNRKKEDETDVQSLFHLVEKESGRGQTLHASHIFLSFYIVTHHSFLL